MTLDEIKRLIEFLREQDLTEFELEHDGVKLRVKSGARQRQRPYPMMSALPTRAPGPP